MDSICIGSILKTRTGYTENSDEKQLPTTTDLNQFNRYSVTSRVLSPVVTDYLKGVL